LDGAGALYCWGANTEGQLGITKTDGTINPAVTTPALVPNASHVTSFALGTAKHSCFIDSGKVYCMGANASGELGRAGDSSPIPVEVVW
jgi:alpha-tubulin suppressor-like RCC1 family protein